MPPVRDWESETVAFLCTCPPEKNTPKTKPTNQRNQSPTNQPTKREKKNAHKTPPKPKQKNPTKPQARNALHITYFVSDCISLKI